MSEQYEAIGPFAPFNPSRPTMLVFLCRTCGALVGDMGRHDANHAAERAAGVQPRT